MSSNPVEPPHYDFPSYGPVCVCVCGGGGGGGTSPSVDPSLRPVPPPM